MKRSNFLALILGTASTMLFALGMCMVLIPQWNAFRPGVIFGCSGLILGLVTVMLWRKMEGKPPIHISGKQLGATGLCAAGILLLGVGMCFCMVWEKLVVGVPLGILGILLLLCLIPYTRGLHD